MPSVDLDNLGPDYELVWPRQVFADEANALMRARRGGWLGQAELLLEEAFAGATPPRGFRTGTLAELLGLDAPSDDIFESSIGTSERDVLQELVDRRDDLREHAIPRPYWSRRHGGAPTPRVFDPGRLFIDWVNLVSSLQEKGYLDQTAPRPCVDSYDVPPVDDLLNAKTTDLLGIADTWPLRRDDWEGDVDRLYSLIEVVHDLVARPRSRSWHDYSQCGWHYDDFALAPARALYRAQVDQILTRNGAPVRFAERGEDLGRLVQVSGDDRETLVTAVLETASIEDRGTVRHAVALFRARGATRDDRRGAVVALARILEARRPLLKQELLSRDEGALFALANQFDVRHNRVDQQRDYDEVFLIWIFWWYLATIELTDRLIERQPPHTAVD